MKAPARESGAALPTAGFDAVVFDLDAVLGGARPLDAWAWKTAFDGFFRASGREAEPFSIETEYPASCQGRPYLDAVAAVLAARDIRLRRGTTVDPPGHDSIHGLAGLQHAIFFSLLETGSIDYRDPALDLVAEFRLHGLHTAVVSPGRNCIPLLAAAGALELFDAKLDGPDAERASLMPTPAPDYLTAIAHELDIPPGRCIAVEESPDGVSAARAANYGRVIALNRDGPERAETLARAGADSIIDDQWLVERDVAGARHLSSADLAALEQRLQDARPALIVDYEGTLVPNRGLPRDDPRAGRLQRLLERLARRHPTMVISECDLEDLRAGLDVPGIGYAASDGRDVELPDGRREHRQEESSAASGWDRGAALQRLLELSGLAGDSRVVPVYMGDDVRDEDAFAAVDEHGVGILVGRTPPRASIARFTLPDHDAVHRLLAWFSQQ